VVSDEREPRTYGASWVPTGLRTASGSLHWSGSIRFRLTVLYSAIVFGLASIAVGAIYFGLARELRADTIVEGSTQAQIDTEFGPGFIVDGADLERAVNDRALSALRNYSILGLGSLFFGAVAVGWYLSGRVLEPIDRITAVAREITGSDLTSRIELGGPEDELRLLADTFDSMLDRIEAALTSQTRFIQEASHELRNPLAVIRTNLDVVLSDPDAEADELRQTGEVVRRSAERMSTLVDDLLVYARLDVPSSELESVDLVQVVREVSEEFSGPAKGRQISIERLGPSVLLVHGDPVALRRALINLVGNAVRLAPEGSVLTIQAEQVDRRAAIRVIDQGPGISLADQQRVFDRFWRGASRDDDRRGLGLAIVSRIARAHNGSVSLESELGEGSTFTIDLPIHAPRPDDEPAAPGPDTHEILVVGASSD